MELTMQSKLLPNVRHIGVYKYRRICKKTKVGLENLQGHNECKCTISTKNFNHNVFLRIVLNHNYSSL